MKDKEIINKDIIGKFFNNAVRVVLKGSVFAKTTITLVFLMVFVGVSIWKINNEYIITGLIILTIFIVLIIVFRLINFANKNPQAAILEGAEFIKHEAIMLAAKDKGAIPDTQQALVEDTPVIIDVTLEKESNETEKEEQGGEVENG